MLSAIEFLKEKIKNEFGFVASDNVYELAIKMERQNLDTAYQMGIDHCKEAYEQIIKSASKELENHIKQTDENIKQLQ
jgi:hypothetical protein